MLAATCASQRIRVVDKGAARQAVELAIAFVAERSRASVPADHSAIANAIACPVDHRRAKQSSFIGCARHWCTTCIARQAGFIARASAEIRQRRPWLLLQALSACGAHSAGGASVGVPTTCQMLRLAALASLEDQSLAGNTTCQEAAGHVTSAILASAAADRSGRTWQSLSDVLPLLAEAAPAEFLDAVLDDLDTASPVLRTMFQDDQSLSWMGGSSPHTGLLWALEVLCWSPDYLDLASLALAKLQQVDPGGRLANRPLASLQSILVFWIRHTSAPLAVKVAAIEAICQRVPAVGWQLLLALWPSTHATAMPPASPRYRDWQPDRRGVPVAEVVEFIGRLVSLAISLANADVNRWKDLANAIAPLPPDQRTALLDALEQVAGSGSVVGRVQLELWEALRAEVDRHRQFSDATWAMDEATVDRLERIANLVKPTDGAERFAYMFDWHVDLPDIERLDFRARETLVAAS